MARTTGKTGGQFLLLTLAVIISQATDIIILTIKKESVTETECRGEKINQL